MVGEERWKSSSSNWLSYLDVVLHLVGTNPSGRGRVGIRSGVFQGGRGGHPSCNSSSVARRPFLSGSLVVLVTQLMSLL